jgi:hypothetical protein
LCELVGFFPNLPNPRRTPVGKRQLDPTSRIP